MRGYVWLWLSCLMQSSLGRASLITARAELAQTTGTPQAEFANLAIEPTASGQIGVNPVTDLGDAATYIGQVFGTDTFYITVIGTTTKVCRNVCLLLRHADGSTVDRSQHRIPDYGGIINHSSSSCNRHRCS